LKYRWCAAAAALLVAFANPARAQSQLFYLEAQAVGGYSKTLDRGILYSMTQEDAMQKPSVGFDWIRRLSGETRDFGSVGLQVRLAYNHEPESKLELQVYNAYLRYKANFANLWAGHDRPAFGLSSYLDSHSLLLPTLAMMGYGFDRDWGAGVARDFGWGGVTASLTTGSGMPLYFRGNYLASARLSRGVLERDSWNLGLSAASGEMLETIGYELISDDPFEFHMGAMDGAWLWRRFESRVEIMAGRKMEHDSYAACLRLGMNLLAENRLKIEAQPVLMKMGEESSFSMHAGVSYQLTADLALRSLYRYDDENRDHTFIAQVYYYKRV